MDDDTGSAALEFIAAGVILLVPLAYLILALGTVQHGVLGVEAAARHTARVISQSHDAASAEAGSAAVLASIIDEYGLDASSVDLSLTCTPVGSTCPAAGATMVVSVRAVVPLPFIPAVLGLDTLTGVQVEAAAAQKMSRLWGTG